MYVVQQEVNFNGTTHQVGDLIENPTNRMIELGIVQVVKPKKAKKVKKEKVVEVVEVVEPVVEILTEISDSVDVDVDVAVEDAPAAKSWFSKQKN
jgi:hypothetical protein